MATDESARRNTDPQLQMRSWQRKREFVFLGLSLVLGVVAAVVVMRHSKSLPDNESAATYENLKIVVLEHRRTGDEITIRYGLQWLRVKTETPVIFMRPFNTVTVAFFDQDEKYLSEENKPTSLNFDFLAHQAPICKMVVHAKIPRNAQYFSVAIGLLATKKIGPVIP